MKKRITLFVIFIILNISLLVNADSGPADYKPIEHSRQNFTKDMHVSRGGQLYDNWWKATVDTEKPKGNQPLWNTQDTNKRSGYSTYRCKECHGWDYKGKDGAYGKGSHFTGFKGIYEASRSMSLNELKETLTGAIKHHDFSGQLTADDVSDLALFMKFGTVDLVKYINTDGSPVSGDLNKGNEFFSLNCMTECHGPDGTGINFGDEEKPEFIGTIARKNPWEFIHKVRAGQPGTKMSSGIINKWTDKDIRDLLVYARTLPTALPEPGWFDRIIETLGIGEKKQISYKPEEDRGFGPKITQAGEIIVK